MDRDQKGQRCQNTEKEYARFNDNFKVEQTHRKKVTDTNDPDRLPLASFDNYIKMVSTEAL